MNIKKSNVIVAVICMAALSGTSYYSGYAAGNSGIQYNSQGKIVFDNGTEDTIDDVIFDASDFITIDSMVTDGKASIKDELNRYDSIEISEDTPAFNTLAAAVDAISDGTDATAGNILSGKTALVGKSLVTGSMDDHSGSRTDTNKITENGTNAEITIPGGYYDENSKITIPIDTIMKLPAINSNLAHRIEIPVTLTSHCAATTNNDIHHGEKNVKFTIIIENNKLTISGDTSIATGADGFAYYAIATASATVGQIVVN